MYAFGIGGCCCGAAASPCACGPSDADYCNEAMTVSDFTLNDYGTGENFTNPNATSLLLEDADPATNEPSTDDDAAAYISGFAVPSGSGYTIEVGGTLYRRYKHANFGGGIRSSTVMVFIGGAMSAGIRPRFGDFLRADCNSVGLNTGGSATFGTWTDVTDDGKEIILKLTDVGSGNFDVEIKFDGSVIRTESTVAFTLPDPFNIGVLSTDSGAWECLWCRLTDGT